MRGLKDMCLTLKEKSDIEKRANEFLDSMNENRGIIDIVAFAESKGFEVFLSKMPEKDEDGAIYIGISENEKKTQRILISNKLSYPTARFVIAHELGHYVLHYNEKEMNEQEGKVFFHVDTHSNKSKDEQAADYFAACILLPKDVFRNKYEELISRIRKSEVVIDMLSQIFIANPRTVQRRISEVYESEI